MNILVIKQTSLGDVLHSTPHIRAIKACYPQAHLTLLTAQGSAGIYADNPDIDRLVLFDYAGFKRAGLRSPRKLLAIFKSSLAELNHREYDLAFDLQGLARSVVFLYRVQAKQKYVKGRWPGLKGFRNKQLHAIDEMSQVLGLAGIDVADTRMAFYRAPRVADDLRDKLSRAGLEGLLDTVATGKQQSDRFVVISPFTRWASKNWPLANFAELAVALSENYRVLITGAPTDRGAIGQALQESAPASSRVDNLAGDLSLPELAELMSHAALVVSGDSFPMHLATAVGVPLLTLFGPTDETRTGPRSDNSVVLRPDDCNACDQPNCKRACLQRIKVDQLLLAARAQLDAR